MQKYFTKEVTQAFKVIVLGLAIGLGVSFVSANWTAPVSPAPGCTAGNPGCDAPINISSVDQGKNGNKITGYKLFIHDIFGADDIIATRSFNAGGLGSNLAEGTVNIFSQLTVNRSAKNGSQGRNLFNLVGSADNDSVGVIQNKPWFFFWDYVNAQRAGVRAGNGDFEGTVKIVDGTQGVGKVFSSDASGSGSWGSISGGGLDVITVGRTRSVTNMTQFNTETYCPATHPILLGGGGDCEYPAGIRESHPVYPGNVRPGTGNNTDVTSTQPAQSGWRTVCAAPATSTSKDVHAWAICAKASPVTVASSSTGGPINVGQWYDVTDGTIASPQDYQTCTDRYNRPASKIRIHATTPSGTVADYNGECIAYQGGSSWVKIGANASLPAGSVGFVPYASGGNLQTWTWQLQIQN